MSIWSLPKLQNHTSPFFFFNDTATTEIYTLSLHDALPICDVGCAVIELALEDQAAANARAQRHPQHVPSADSRADRKSTRLNSSHLVISYAVFCLKKKNNDAIDILMPQLRAITHDLTDPPR